jgi:hypothetical protein
MRPDTDLGHPVRTYLVLRAWALWRAKSCGFVARNHWRQRWYEQESSELRRDISQLGVAGGGTGQEVADGKIRNWAPHVLQP